MDVHLRDPIIGYVLQLAKKLVALQERHRRERSMCLNIRDLEEKFGKLEWGKGKKENPAGFLHDDGKHGSGHN
jgi:hypothetical protein